MNLPFVRAVEDPEPIIVKTNQDSDPFGIKALRTIILRRWMLMSAVATVVAGALFAMGMMQPERYTASALIMISPGQERVLSPEKLVTDSGAFQSGAVIDSEIEIIRSAPMIGRVVDAANLINDPEWSWIAARREREGLDPATTSESLSEAERDSLRLGAISALQGAITVRRRGMTFAIDLSVTSRNPERAVQLANRLADSYLRYQLEARFEAAQRANNWLSTRLSELRAEVQQKEAAATEFAARNGLLTTGGNLLSEQQTQDIQGAVLAARSDLAEKEARYRQVQTLQTEGASAETVVGILGSGVVSDLRSREAEIARRQADFTARYGELHPAVQNVQAERADIQRQINAEITRISVSMRNEVEISRLRLATLQNSLNSMRGQLVSNNDSLVQLRELERDAAATRAVYESFLQRFNEITDQGNLQLTNARLISRATGAGQTSPNLKIALVLAIAIGLALGFGVGLLLELLDEGLSSADEVERKVGVPAVASIPRLRSSELAVLPPEARHPAGFLVNRQMSAFAESLRVLRTAVVYGQLDRKTQVVAITSALPDEGKTTISLCLARIAALSGQRVLLVDCDLRRRSLKDVLDLQPKAGLLQVLAGEAHWRETIFVDEGSGMHLLPLSETSFTPRDVFGSDAMANFIAEQRNHYDLIVLDCAPILTIAETRILVAMADSSLLVARSEKTSARAVKTAIHQIEITGAKLIGIALNYIDPRVPGTSSYGDSLYYTSSGKNYYQT